MSRIERVIDKIDKLGKKHNLGALAKMVDDPDDEVRSAVAKSIGQISSYEAGMQLIPLLRDAVPTVRSAAAEAVGMIHAKHCEEYVKKLAYSDTDPEVRRIAHEAFEKIRTPVI
jgi:HEAT repeat protein